MSFARCPRCNAALAAADISGAEQVVTCANCRRKSWLTAFPALVADSVRTPPPPLEHDSPGEGEAACFYSPTRRATKECGHCGVLISETWAAAWGSKTVCLKCLEHLRADTKNVQFQTKRILWDNIVLTLAIVPCTIIFWWSVFVTAPAALFLGIWHWNSPRSIVPNSRLRLILGLLLASLQIVGMGLVLFGVAVGFANSSAAMKP